MLFPILKCIFHRILKTSFRPDWMNANFGYGLIAMVAYNFLRIIARLDQPDKPHYAKKLREKYIYIPGKVVKHARQIFLRIPERFKKEVELMTKGWAGKLEAALAIG